MLLLLFFFNQIQICSSSRGLDIHGLEHVINYDLPSSGGLDQLRDTYIHRRVNFCLFKKWILRYFLGEPRHRAYHCIVSNLSRKSVIFFRLILTALFIFSIFLSQNFTKQIKRISNWILLPDSESAAQVVWRTAARPRSSRSTNPTTSSSRPFSSRFEILYLTFSCQKCLFSFLLISKNSFIISFNLLKSISPRVISIFIKKCKYFCLKNLIPQSNFQLVEGAGQEAPEWLKQIASSAGGGFGFSRSNNYRGGGGSTSGTKSGGSFGTESTFNFFKSEGDRASGIVNWRKPIFILELEIEFWNEIVWVV